METSTLTLLGRVYLERETVNNNNNNIIHLVINPNLIINKLIKILRLIIH